MDALRTGGIVLLLAVTSGLSAEDQPYVPVRERLDTKLTAKFRRTPLHEVLTTIGDAVDLRIVIDGDALKAEGYTRNMSQDAEFDDVAAGVALSKIVGKYPKLTFLVDDFGDRIVITSEDGRRRLQKPPGDPKEDAAWRSLVGSEQLAAETVRLRDRLRPAAESQRQFKTTRLSARRDTQRFVVVAQIAARHPDGLSEQTGSSLANAGRRLGKAFADPGGFGDAKQAFQAAEEVLRQRRALLTTRNPNPPDPPKLELIDVMHTLEATLKAMNVKELAEDDASERLAARIATAAAAARLATYVDVDEYGADAEFLGHARGLERDLGVAREAVDDVDLEALRESIKSVGKRCAACHASFR